ncbi:Sigma-54 interaction domain-containing protein [Desulfonema limicola]|uniref:Sigma-54 interaction domain-containing protein n=1 Tax=Desulfonema limicola TaxID=45656 RepID=A0A975BF78_9BACT|nr:sigma 54-interacting transcriptional regulator [Desulfonema limicola]QTA83965.1 Sigma-54 interaction domain-containing protein [Desulfonema limicola]
MPNNLKKNDAFADIITCNPEMFSIFQYVETASQNFEPILITGEPGVGKKLLAKSLHTASKKKGKWVIMNVAGLDDAAFSDLLFGKKNKFSEGMIKAAEDGTLLLNEIGGLPPVSQVKLLRLLQNKEGVKTKNPQDNELNVRFIAATENDLWQLQRKGEFHNDLNAMFRRHHIHIPPLRERAEDIPLLINHFLDQAALAMNKKRPTPPKELFILLSTYSFPENIRELKTMIFDAVRRHKSKVLSLDVFKYHIDREHKDIYVPPKLDADDASPFKFFRELPTIKQITLLLVEEAMKRANGNQSIAARMLGISQPALSKRLKNASLRKK